MNNKSFTLIELLVVIAIIGVLAAILITTISGAVTKSRIVRLQVFSDTIRAQLSDSLVSYWSFNEGSGTDAKDMWEGNHGTLGGDPEWKSGGDCISGSCLEFDGSGDYVSLGRPSSLINQTALSIFLWVKTADDVTSDQYWFYGGYWHSPYGDYIRVNSGNLGINLRNTVAIGKSGGPVTSNTWYYVGYSWDGSIVHVYTNGIEIGTGTVFTGILARTPSTAINLGGYTTAFRCKGLIDEVRIYSSAASITQVQSQYLVGLDKLLSNGAISKSEYNQRIKELSKEIVIE